MHDLYLQHSTFTLSASPTSVNPSLPRIVCGLNSMSIFPTAPEGTARPAAGCHGAGEAEHVRCVPNFHFTSISEALTRFTPQNRRPAAGTDAGESTWSECGRVWGPPSASRAEDRLTETATSDTSDWKKKQRWTRRYFSYSEAAKRSKTSFKTSTKRRYKH